MGALLCPLISGGLKRISGSISLKPWSFPGHGCSPHPENIEQKDKREIHIYIYMLFQDAGTLVIAMSFARAAYLQTKTLVRYVTWKNIKEVLTIRFKPFGITLRK